MTSLKTYISGIIITFISATALAQDGSSAYNFLNIPSSSHIYGLGEANISTVEDDINITDQNPALLGQEMDMQLGLNYMRYVGESDFAGVKFARKFKEHGTWAAGVQYFSYGEMKSTEIDGTVTGTFTAKDIAISLAYSHDITDRLRGGINLKFITSSYEEYSAMALATDLGLNYYNPELDQSFSFTIANLGGQIKRFHESYDRLPIDVRLGWTQSFGALPIRFSITAWNLTKWKLPYYETGDGTTDERPQLKESFGSNLFRHLILAADFIPSDRFHLGIGYNYKTRTDMTTYARNFLSGLSFSAGIRVKMFGVGVAFAQPHIGGTTFMVNLTTNILDFIR